MVPLSILHSYISNMSVYLYLYKNAQKTLYDSITFTKIACGFSVTYRYDLGTDGEMLPKHSSVSYMDTALELLEFLKLTLDLLIADVDLTPYHSIDLIMKGFPIVRLKPTKHSKYLILNAFKFWLPFQNSEKK